MSKQIRIYEHYHHRRDHECYTPYGTPDDDYSSPPLPVREEIPDKNGDDPDSLALWIEIELQENRDALGKLAVTNIEDN